MAKYYWLKLEKQFFKRHDIKLLRQENRQYVEIYTELMAESLDHEGALRFSAATPYTDEDLAGLIECDVKLFKKAMASFIKRELVSVDKDGTIWASLVTKRIGSRGDSADRMKRYREKQKAQAQKGASQVTNSDVTSYSNSESSIPSSLEDNDGVLKTYKTCIEALGLPTLAWPDTHKQYAALKDIAERTRALAPDSRLPDPVEFAKGIMAVFKRKRDTGKGEYWKGASPAPVALLRRFDELVTGLGDEYQRAADDEAGMAALRRMGKV